MSENVYLKDTTLSAIGDAIRYKTGKSGLLLPSQMPDEIKSISGGGGDEGIKVGSQVELRAPWSYTSSVGGTGARHIYAIPISGLTGKTKININYSILVPMNSQRTINYTLGIGYYGIDTEGKYSYYPIQGIVNSLVTSSSLKNETYSYNIDPTFDYKVGIAIFLRIEATGSTADSRNMAYIILNSVEVS